MCACPRDKVIETYVVVQTLEERGVLFARVLVFGGENDFSMCGCGGVDLR